MKTHISSLEIKNFKTVKHIKIDCKKINLFVGKPNVGKSNILEGLSLLGANYSQKREKFLSDFIRYEKLENLFYDQETANRIEIITDIGVAYFRYHFNIHQYDIIVAPDKNIFNFIKSERSIHDITEEFQQYENNITTKNKSAIHPFYTSIHAHDNTQGGYYGEGMFTNPSPVKKYDFAKFEKYENRFHFFLLPPDGKNLYTIIQRNKQLYKELTSFFKDYKLKLVLNKKESNLEIQKEIDGVVYSYPYFTIADTLQRIIFHIMAIKTNKDSILLFEEPEAHSFPPYIKMLAEKIIEDKSNQYFITTHSPFILNTIIENAPSKDVTIYLTSYEKYQTKVRLLKDKEIKDMLDYGSDIFFNLK